MHGVFIELQWGHICSSLVLVELAKFGTFVYGVYLTGEVVM